MNEALVRHTWGLLPVTPRWRFTGDANDTGLLFTINNNSEPELVAILTRPMNDAIAGIIFVVETPRTSFCFSYKQGAVEFVVRHAH